MKKFVSLALALVMVLALAVPAMAAPKTAAEPSNTATVEGFAFHCNTNGGNGKTYIVGKDKDFGKKTNITLTRNANDPTVWDVPETSWECAACGRTEWISFSNKSGVPDGKNIQLNHPAQENPPVNYESGWTVIPMVSEGYTTVSLGAWNQSLLNPDLITAVAYDEAQDLFYNDFAIGEKIWIADSTVTNYGVLEDLSNPGILAKFEFTYAFEDFKQDGNVKFTNFKIVADNNFVLVLNDQIVGMSDFMRTNWALFEGCYNSDDVFAVANWEGDNESVDKGFSPVSNFYWNKEYTFYASEMLAAYVASGSPDYVNITVYGYNNPDKGAAEAGGNPACIMFAGTLAHEWQVEIQ